ncbi:hypothetical protein GCM10022232_11380 [Streptomyces plumbiresistens]|uniref:ATP-binding protein n=1 Tax=Streptomyces plumbiresistens TaxID=511811 RepID=A0ABP7QH07_9ACTN
MPRILPGRTSAADGPGRSKGPGPHPAAGGSVPVHPSPTCAFTSCRREATVRHQRGPAIAESGRGLLLVEALADRWGTAQGPHPRKTVWAELCLPPEHRNACSGGRGAFPKEPRRRKDPTKPHPTLPPRRTPPHPGE